MTAPGRTAGHDLPMGEREARDGSPDHPSAGAGTPALQAEEVARHVASLARIVVDECVSATAAATLGVIAGALESSLARISSDAKRIEELTEALREIATRAEVFDCHPLNCDGRIHDIREIASQFADKGIEL
jgi:Asp-tRNA(Asn)/Glu-tRNA(Gln) amidotransferase C subunit